MRRALAGGHVQHGEKQFLGFGKIDRHHDPP
jgi:hypothetical protein